MSEGAAEAGGDAPLSDGQFGDVPGPTDTAQNPGDGVFGVGWYGLQAFGSVTGRINRQSPQPQYLPPRSRRKRKRTR